MAKEQLTGWLTIVRKETVRIFRIWSQTLVPPVITTSLYLLIFGKLLGSRFLFGQSLNYLHFISPGIILMAVITNSYGNTSASFFGAKFSRSIEELLVSPLNTHTILIGYITGGLLRGIFVGFLVGAMTFLFNGDLGLKRPILAMGILVLVSLVFSLGGILNALLAKNFDDINFIPTFVLTPLTYLGGIFYSKDMLPEFWQVVLQFNPIYYMISSFRYAFFETNSQILIISVIFLATLIILLYMTNFFLIEKGNSLRQ